MLAIMHVWSIAVGCLVYGVCGTRTQDALRVAENRTLDPHRFDPLDIVR
jgi:hypothetical protein